MRFGFVAACGLLVSAVAVPSVSAQVAPALDPGVMVGWAGGEAVRYDNERRARAAAQPSVPQVSLRQSFTAPPNASAATIASFGYSPSTSVRRDNFARFVERSRAVDPQGARQLEQLLASSDTMPKVQGYLARYGLSASNAADAIAVYLVAAWQATRADDGDPDREALVAVRDQVASALAATPQMRAATDAQKQELAEVNLIQAILVSQFAALARERSDMRESIADAVAQGARSTYGIQLQSLELTANGFRPLRTGALDGDPRPQADEDGSDVALAGLGLIGVAGLGAFGVWKLRGHASRG